MMMKCKVKDCSWRGKDSDLLTHCQDEHPKEWEKAHRQTIHEIKNMFPSLLKEEPRHE